jgi:hypothetical protein
MDPLKYGKLLDQTNNKFIIQLTTKNVAVITHYEKENFIRIFKNGDLVLEFRDKFINENSFIRTLNDTKFLFENDKLISTQILSALGAFTIFNSDNINPLKNPIEYFYKTNIFKNYQAELFILMEVVLILLVILFFILTEDSDPIQKIMAGNIIKLRKVAPKYKWNELIFNVNNKVFSESLLEDILDKFWNKIEIEFTENNHMFILFKIKYLNSEFSSIGTVQRLNLVDKNWYRDFILETMKFKSEYYNETQIDSIIMSFGFKQGKVANKENFVLNVTFQNYKNFNLPVSMNPNDYGRVIIKNELKNSINYILQNEKGQTINFNQFEKHNEVEFFNRGISLIKFVDSIFTTNKFIRVLDDKKYIFENGAQVLFTKLIKTKFIAKTNKHTKLIDNFITLDIETFINENGLTPYLISFCDGKNSYSFGLWNYNNSEEMILDCLNSVMSRKYNGYKVYVHNLAKFDIIFLLKYLVKVGNLQPVIHNDRIISLTVKYGKNNKYQIQFKDSYLILLASLSKLSSAFQVENEKSVFPHFFVNENNLNYVGEIPELKFFKNISEKDYQSYKSNFLIIEILKMKQLNIVI